MANALTGDFEAVAEVSGRTLNRLMASLHQQADTGTSLPTLPHEAVLRIGDKGFHTLIDGVRGTAWAQIGSPTIELVDRMNDRFWLEAWIRVRFVADPATAAFPEFVYGKVRALYAMSIVRGRDERVGTRMVFGVVPESVSFTSGTPDTSHDAQVTAQVRHLLVARFRPTPHKLLADFEQRRYGSLVGGGESALVHPLDVTGKGAGGDVARVDRLFLGGRDFAVAVSRELILAMVQPALDGLKASKPQFTIKLDVWKPWPLVEDFPGAWRTVGQATYEVSITAATATWAPGIVTVHVAGTAVTPSDLAPNGSFSVDQQLALVFHPATETLSLDPLGAPDVSVSVNGPFEALVRSTAENIVTKMFNTQLGQALNQAKPQLQATVDQKWKLINQLKTLDAQGSARLESAEHLADGVVLRGSIGLTPRRTIVVTAEMLADGRGYTGLHSWVPGGRIVQFYWHWYWQTTSIPTGAVPDGSEVREDRFVLRTTVPVPGVPVDDPGGGPAKVPYGRLCLTIKGVRLDAVTGLEESVDNIGWQERNCVYVVPSPPSPLGKMVAAKLRRWWTMWVASGASGGTGGGHAVAAYVDADGASAARFNTLVHYVDDVRAIESVRALAGGLRDARRDDAGVLVAVVVREGLLDGAGGEARAALDRALESIAAPVMLTDDVQAGWSRSLELPAGRGGAATRLLDAAGETAWRHDGAADAAAIAAALRERLLPSPPPRPEPLGLAVEPGAPLPPVRFEGPAGTWTGLDQLHGTRVSLTFVQAWARPCIAQLRRLERLRERLQHDGVVVMALVDGVTAADAEALARASGLGFTVGADPSGAVALRLGVRAWPTTLAIDEEGRLAGVEMGTDPGALAGHERETTVTA
jgi:peroxiredoxin